MRWHIHRLYRNPVFVFCFGLWLMAFSGYAQAALPTPQTLKGLSDFPALLVPNQGQWDATVRYAGRAQGAEVAFGAEGVGFYLHDQGNPKACAAPACRDARGAGRCVAADREAAVRLYALEGNLSELVPEKALPTRVSYLRGDNPAHWQSQLPSYAQLRYTQVYPGIDWVLRSHEHHLVYDWVVAPQADPAQIRLALEGIRELQHAADGSLVATLPNGIQLQQHAPVIYQKDGEVRQPVDGAFVILEASPELGRYVIGFALGDYDENRTLVIDPTVSVEYSAVFGGAANDEIKAMAVTANGRVIAVGSTLSTALPGTAREQGPRARRDGLLLQFSPDASSLEHVLILGGSNDEQINAIALQQQGTQVSLYLTGQTNSPNFPIPSGVAPSGLYPVLPGGRPQAAFVAKVQLDQPNNPLVFAGYWGGSGVDAGKAIDLDAAGNIYVAGETASGDLPTRNALYPSYPRGKSVFVLKLDPAAQFVHYASYFGGSGNDDVVSMKVIKALNGIYDGTVFLSGFTASRDFPTTTGTFQPANPGGTSGFVARIGPQGTELVFATYLGGSRNDVITDMVLGPPQDPHLFISGYTNSENFPVTSALYPALAGNNDAFVAKLDQYGRFVHFATYLGGNADDRAHAIAIDQARDTGLHYIYVGGQTQSHNFPTHHAIEGHSYLRAADARSRDGFIAKLDPRGLDLLYASFFGGIRDDAVWALATRANARRQVFIAGSTTARDASHLFPVPSDATKNTQYYLLGDDRNTSTNIFTAQIRDELYDPRVPRLELSYANTYPEGTAKRSDQVKLELFLRDPLPVGISGFASVVTFDAQALDFDPQRGIVWNDAQLPDHNREVQVLEPGRLGIWMLYQRQPVRTIANDTRVLELYFTVTDRSRLSKQLPVRMEQANTTANNVHNQTVFIRAVSGGILLDRPCNDLIGDCDCSGQVALFEVQHAASTVLANQRNRCMQTDRRTDLRIDVLDLTRIVNLHIGTPRPATTPAQGAQLQLANVRANGRALDMDLIWQGQPQGVSAMTVDLYYDDAHFEHALSAARLGIAAQNAGKTLSYNALSAGRLRILLYGLNDHPLQDGVIATLSLVPLSQSQNSASRIRPVVVASNPQAQPVSVSSDEVIVMGGQPPRLRQYVNAGTTAISVRGALSLEPRPGVNYQPLEIRFADAQASLLISSALAPQARFRLHPDQSYQYRFNAHTGRIEVLRTGGIFVVSLPVNAQGHSPEIAIGNGTLQRIRVNLNAQGQPVLDTASFPVAPVASSQ